MEHIRQETTKSPENVVKAEFFDKLDNVLSKPPLKNSVNNSKSLPALKKPDGSVATLAPPLNRDRTSRNKSKVFDKLVRLKSPDTYKKKKTFQKLDEITSPEPQPVATMSVYEKFDIRVHKLTVLQSLMIFIY